MFITKIYNGCKLFFYSFVIRDLFLTKILKINILTVDILHYTGMVKKLGGLAGGAAGASLTTCGIPPIIGTPLGVAIGSIIGSFIDKELYKINNTVKVIDNKNDEYVDQHKTELYISNKINDAVNQLLQLIQTTIQNDISDQDKKLNDDSLISKLTLYVMNNKDSKSMFSNLFLANLLSDVDVKKQLIELIKYDGEEKHNGE